MEKRSRGISLYMLLFVAAIILFFVWSRNTTRKMDYISHSEFEEYLAGNEIAAISIAQNSEVPTGVVQITLRNGGTRQMYVADVKEVETELRQKFPSYTLRDVKRDNWFIAYMLPSLVVIGVIIFIFSYMNSQSAASGGGYMMNFGKNRAKYMMNFGKNRAKLAAGDNKITFNDVAGLKEEKEDLEEIVDFLKNPGKYNDLGARIPKGVILTGPPGTGKFACEGSV